MWWTPHHAGFEFRLIATFSEWLMASFMLFYIISFTKEFKTMKFKGILLQDEHCSQ